MGPGGCLCTWPALKLCLKCEAYSGAAMRWHFDGTQCLCHRHFRPHAPPHALHMAAQITPPGPMWCACGLAPAGPWFSRPHMASCCALWQHARAVCVWHGPVPQPSQPLPPPIWPAFDLCACRPHHLRHSACAKVPFEHLWSSGYGVSPTR